MEWVSMCACVPSALCKVTWQTKPVGLGYNWHTYTHICTHTRPHICINTHTHTPLSPVLSLLSLTLRHSLSLSLFPCHKLSLSRFFSHAPSLLSLAHTLLPPMHGGGGWACDCSLSAMWCLTSLICLIQHCHGAITATLLPSSVMQIYRFCRSAINKSFF